MNISPLDHVFSDLDILCFALEELQIVAVRKVHGKFTASIFNCFQDDLSLPSSLLFIYIYIYIYRYDVRQTKTLQREY